MAGLFITATGTDVGKTVIAGAVAAALQNRGMRIGVMKPAASGCGMVNGKLKSEDTSFLMCCAGVDERQRENVNPYCFAPPLTPAVAAKVSGAEIKLDHIFTAYQKLNARNQGVIVEGAGGMAAPLWQDYLMVNLMQDLKLPLLLVADAKLGTINYTVLSVEYAKQHNLTIVGIVLNNWDEKATGVLETSNEYYITKLTGIPVLGRFPHIPSIDVQTKQYRGIGDLAEKHLAIDALYQLILQQSEAIK